METSSGLSDWRNSPNCASTGANGPAWRPTRQLGSAHQRGKNIQTKQPKFLKTARTAICAANNANQVRLSNGHLGHDKVLNDVQPTTWITVAPQQKLGTSLRITDVIIWRDHAVSSDQFQRNLWLGQDGMPSATKKPGMERTQRFDRKLALVPVRLSEQTEDQGLHASTCARRARRAGPPYSG